MNEKFACAQKGDGEDYHFVLIVLLRIIVLDVLIVWVLVASG